MQAEIVRLSLHQIDFKILRGEQIMLILDPKTEYGNWGNPNQRISGVRLEAKDSPIVAYGTLDPKALEKPSTFSDWMKKTMGMDWG